MSDVLNKGIPIKLPGLVEVNSDVLFENAIDKEKFENFCMDMLANMTYNIEKDIIGCSYRKIVFQIDFLIKYQEETKRNLLMIDTSKILYSILEYLNISNCLTERELRKKIDDLSFVVTERKLEKKFPKLYEIYLHEMKVNEEMNYHHTKEGISIPLLASAYGADEEFIRTSLKINNVKNFCRVYADIIKRIIDNLELIDKYFQENPIDVFKDNAFIEENLEAYFVIRYLEELEQEEDISKKQKYLYYVSHFFNDHKNWINSDIGFMIEGRKVMFDDIYNAYVDILIKNPTLRVFDYEREFFDKFTAKEVEEYMELELASAKANWNMLEDGFNEERIGRAIYNGIKGINDTEKRRKTQEELKSLYLAKRSLFDNISNYRVVEGCNTFDGYVAFIYPNGKVILERFFEKRKDGSEVIATEQAIYIMNIDEFYSLTSLSKSTIIRDNLCKRIIHKGDWQSKVLKEINTIGDTPNKEFQGLVLRKKIEDIQ